jgi:TP901 family phage tail tape measure protein
MGTPSGDLEIGIVLKTNKAIEQELQAIENRALQGGRTIGRELAKGADEGTSAYERLNRMVERNHQAIRNLGLAALAAAAAVSGIIGLSVRQFAEFEESIARATGAAGGNREMLTELMGVARGASAEFARAGVTAKQAGDALFFLTSAGLSARDAARVLNDVLLLGAATQTDFETSARLVVQTMLGFKISMDESARVVNVLAALNQVSTFEVRELGAAMRQVAPVAGNLNISLEATSAALAVLRNAGRQAEQAGTDLRNMIIRLLNPSAEGKAVLHQLGLTIQDVNPQVHRLADIIDKLRERNLTAKQAAELFTQEGVVGYLALANVGGEALRKLQEKITGTKAAEEQWATQREILSATFKELSVVTNTLAIEIGELAAKRIGPATERTVAWLKALLDLSPELKNTAVDVAAVSVVVLTMVGSGALALAFWGAFGAAIVTATVAIAGFVVAVAPWVVVITALGYALYELETRTGAVSTAWEKLTTDSSERLKELNFQISQMERGEAALGSWWDPEGHKQRLDGLKAERDAIRVFRAQLGPQRAGERVDLGPQGMSAFQQSRRGEPAWRFSAPEPPEPPAPKKTDASRDLARQAAKMLPESELAALAAPLQAAIEKMKLPPEVERSWMEWADSVAQATHATKVQDKATDDLVKEINKYEVAAAEAENVLGDWRVQQLAAVRAVEEFDTALVEFDRTSRRASAATRGLESDVVNLESEIFKNTLALNAENAALGRVGVTAMASLSAHARYGTALRNLAPEEQNLLRLLAEKQIQLALVKKQVDQLTSENKLVLQLKEEVDVLGRVGAAALAARLSWSFYGKSLDAVSPAEQATLRLLGEKELRLLRLKVAGEQLSQANKIALDLEVAGLSHLLTATQAKDALELQSRQSLTESAIGMRQRLADKEHTDHINALSETKIRAQEERNVLTFFGASLGLAAAQAGTFWQGMEGVAKSTAQAMSQGLSDLFFKVFTRETVSATEVFETFSKAILRSLTNLLAEQVVITLFGLAAKAGSAIARGGGILGLLGFAQGGLVGRDGGPPGATDTIPALLSAGEMVLPKEVVDKVGSMLGGTPGASGSLIGGFSNLLTNLQFGGMQGALLGLTPAQHLAAIAEGAISASAGVSTVGTAGLSVVEGGAAAAAGTQGFIGAGGAVSAASTFAAGLGVALNLFTAFSSLGSSTSTGTLAGTVAGAGLGFVVGGPAGALLGAALGGTVGGFLGGLFGGGPSERWLSFGGRLGETLNLEQGATNALTGALKASATTGDVQSAIADWKSAVGGRVGGFGAGSGPFDLPSLPGAGGSAHEGGAVADFEPQLVELRTFVSELMRRLPAGAPTLRASFAAPPMMAVTEAPVVEDRFFVSGGENEDYWITRGDYGGGGGDGDGGGFALGGIARVHDGEVVVPRPFSDEFPALSRALEGRQFSGVGGGRASVVIENLNITVDASDQAWIDKNARQIRRAVERELSNVRVRA